MQAAVRDLTMSLAKVHYADFGPTLATGPYRAQNFMPSRRLPQLRS
jgi:hypothetical protein